MWTFNDETGVWRHFDDDSEEGEERFYCDGNRYSWNPPIMHLKKGDYDGEMIGGPVEESGYYILQYCGQFMCCRPEGPFPDKESALAHSRAQNIDWPAEKAAAERQLSGRDPEDDDLEHLMRQELEKLESDDATEER